MIRIIQESEEWLGNFISEDETFVTVADIQYPDEREWVIPRDIARFEKLEIIIEKKKFRFKNKKR